MTPEEHKALEVWTFAVTTALLRLEHNSEASDSLVDAWNRLADTLQWHTLNRSDIDGYSV
jgi:hypothetical protein